MLHHAATLHRRDWLQAAGAAAVLTAAHGLPTSARGDPAAEPAATPAPAPADLPRVAAINSIYRLRSHAYHIAGRFIHGYTIDGLHHQPPFRLVRMFNHQQPADDLGPEVCRTHGIEACDSVEAALGGAAGLDVDAVLLIIEHGDYPLNDRGQVLYPRYEMFRRIVDVFRASGRSVPVFVDKHLSYDHRHAAEMVATARELGFGLMAGSSLPVTWRLPELDPPLGTPFTEGLAVIGYDRATWEIYLFHVLEVLQCMLERRAGGETGVASVQTLSGDAVWRAGDAGRWSWPLLEHALSRCGSRNYGRVREQVKNPLCTLVEYRDGTRGAVFNLVEAVSEFAFAGRIAGRDEPVSTCFFLPAPPGARFFDPLTWNIERFLASGRSPYPVERTLLTSTLCDHALLSLHEGGRVVADASLGVSYRPPADDGHFRGRFVDRS
jgi:hypothetical protein